MHCMDDLDLASQPVHRVDDLETDAVGVNQHGYRVDELDLDGIGVVNDG